MNIECVYCHNVNVIPDVIARKRKGRSLLQCRLCKKEFEFDFDAAGGDRAREKTEGGDRPGLKGEELKAQILSHVGNLPPMPQVAQRARTILEDEDSSFKDLVDVIETDQSIATRVLKVANSPYYGAGKEITSLQQAAVLLGTKTLQEFLTLTCASSALGTELDGYGLEAGALWQHSLAVAICAQNIAATKHPSLKDDAFSAGLIHDCGKLVLAPYVAERKDAFDRFLHDGSSSFLAAEKEILGFDHAEIGSEVCELWSIPPRIASPIRHHHCPSDAEGDDLAVIIHVADAISLMSGLGVGSDGMMYDTDKAALDSLELDEATIGEFMVESVEYVEKTLSAY